ncbi:MAG: cupin domain-containing protein [Alphaproteobacteria bacterium]|nr:cupin domain-containing protein [Alphaproteobacteria bacterium]
MDRSPLFRAATEGFRWDGVAEIAYKQEGSAPFRDISRQVLFDDPALGCQLRYFEMQPGGYSTLERHEHAHAVMILRGYGACLVGNAVRAVKPRDLVSIPPMTWHQFRASAGEAMGFLCMVNAVRDKPQLPDAEQMKAICANPAVAAFVSGER